MSISEMFQLDNRVAIVTGGAGDLGSAFGLALARAGAKVALADIDHAAAEKRAQKIAADGYECFAVSLDVTSEESAASMAKKVADQLGRIDILVNAAALMKEIPDYKVMNIDMEWWSRVMRINVDGPLVCSRAVVPYMKANLKTDQQYFGKIINITSGGAFFPSGVYGASKLALVSLTTSLATELAQSNINVNALAPGHMDTASGDAARGDNPGLVQALEHMVPLKSFGKPEDLFGALIYLASSASNWVTGQNLNTDGGWVMRL
jgi:NAD(P)-dependent dehydrogenase (short-subunit alcohol dehydrogenase family)